MDFKVLLSHQRPEHLHRCVRIAGLPVCARCTGTYPVAFALFGLLLWLHGEHGAVLAARPWETWVLVGLGLPAVIDWIRSRLDPFRGTNRLRIATGVLLGLSIGRLLYLNAIDMLQPVVVEVLGFFVASVVLGELIVRGYGEEDDDGAPAGLALPLDASGQGHAQGREPGEAPDAAVGGAGEPSAGTRGTDPPPGDAEGDATGRSR